MVRPAHMDNIPIVSATASTPSTPDSPSRWPVWLAWLILALVAATVWVGRVRLAPMPLERDEGEYAYLGQLILQGIPPYQIAWNMKLPGTYAAYAAIMAVGGQTPQAIHLGLLLINAVTAAFLLLLGRRLINPIAGILAAAIFLVTSFSMAVQGTSANAEHFVLLFAVPGLWLLIRAIDTDRIWAMAVAALLLGAGVVMKQHGVMFLIAGAIVFAVHEIRRQSESRLRRLTGRATLFVGAALIPGLLTCIWMASAGVWDEFRFWVFDYARDYGSQQTFVGGLPGLAKYSHAVCTATLGTWILSALGLAVLVFDKTIARRWIIITLLVFSALAIFPGFYFRPHYFVFTLPVAALLGGAAVGAVTRRLTSHWKIGLAIAITALPLATSVAQQHRFWFTTTPAQAIRFLFPRNPFEESVEVAKFLRDRTQPGDTIAVIGSEPQIPFYTRCRSASGFIYMYPLMERHPRSLEFQKQVARELSESDHQFLVLALNPYSWLVNPGTDLWFVGDWLPRYLNDGWRFEFVAENRTFGPPLYSQGADAPREAASLISEYRPILYRESERSALIVMQRENPVPPRIQN